MDVRRLRSPFSRLLGQQGFRSAGLCPSHCKAASGNFAFSLKCRVRGFRGHGSASSVRGEETTPCFPLREKKITSFCEMISLWFAVLPSTSGRRKARRRCREQVWCEKRQFYIYSCFHLFVLSAFSLSWPYCHHWNRYSNYDKGGDFTVSKVFV